MMKLTLITVNYNSSASTLTLLDSLKKQTDKAFNVIVVDNASEQEDFERLIPASDGVRLIRNGENLGFSGGNNIALKEAFSEGSDWALLLNNDSWVGPDYIMRLKAVLSGKEGIAGLPVSEGDTIAYGGKIRWFRTSLKHIHRPVIEGSGSVYVNGASLAISRKAYESLGGLDENYFLYFEDTDYSVRAYKKGIKINFLNEPISNHSVSATTSKLGSPLLLRYHYRNALYFNRKNGPWYVKVLVWPWSFWLMKKQFFKIIFMYKEDKSYAILSAIADFYRNKMGKIS